MNDKNEKKWKKWFLIDKRLPKSSYILRAFAGVYLIYIIGNAIKGLSDPDITNPAAAVAIVVVLSLFCLLCIISGGYGLWKKEYREMYQEDEETEEKNDENI